MVEFYKIPLGILDFNTGQIPGLPANPREWAEREWAERWELSERELAIIQRLNRASHETGERQ